MIGGTARQPRDFTGAGLDELKMCAVLMMCLHDAITSAQSGAACVPDAVMPIISNANHDFSNLSLSDDSSLDRIFTEIPETETIKGVYYQRAQFIRRPEDLVSIDHGLLAVINVGGNRYTFPWSTLEQFPLTRLGRLCGCRSPEDIASVCDDYDEARKEFFFDRSPSAFRVILNFLAAGKLRLLREMCVLSLHDELTYWGVEMAYMERCCKRKMYTRIEEVHDQERREEEHRQRNAMQRVPVEETRYRKVMNWLRDMVENPQSGLPGKIFACMSVIMVAVTVISLCISTMPDLREEEDRGLVAAGKLYAPVQQRLLEQSSTAAPCIDFDIRSHSQPKDRVQEVFSHVLPLNSILGVRLGVPGLLSSLIHMALLFLSDSGLPCAGVEQNSLIHSSFILLLCLPLFG
ncbi:potassium voltage-gated channel subfamily G member 4 [Lates japonicus]|uniref:Potassium voltage-gated channel subfamily G member 4 n=1 Tax=Lates japonicus TaxID=270547 RepID=A0AAD3RA38_LATJO|nr:potassium voltage-gated channel subfamily G member 4 [Lates japonicus]